MKKEDWLMPPSEALKELDMGYYAYRIAAAIFMLLMLMSSSWAGVQGMNPGQTGPIYNSETKSDVQGHGYIMEYNKINTNNLSMLEYSHGSGSMDSADVASSNQTTQSNSMYTYYVLDYTTEQWMQYQIGGNSVICYKKQYNNTQSPTTFDFGTGWYASHPITYNSLLKDKAEAKSYQEGISMDRQVEYARGLEGDIAVKINCTSPLETTPTSYPIGTGSVSMKIADNMSHGSMHVGELYIPTLMGYMGFNDMKIQGEKVPIIDMDVDYVGDFNVQKDMKIEVPKYGAMWATDWLPCCSGGFFDVLNWDTEHAGQRGVFDCTCRSTALSTYQPAWNATMAQFPIKDYRYKP
jgi:hypothetical protein